MRGCIKMNNACFKNEVVEGNLTILEMMYELDKLKQENEQLKADKSELSKERDEWKEGFTLLHNMMEEQKDNTENYDDRTIFEREESDIEEDELANAYAEASKNYNLGIIR